MGDQLMDMDMDSCGTLWHLRLRDNYKTNGNVKITEEKIKQVQIIESTFKELASTIRKMDWTDDGHFSQFTYIGDFWPKYPLKCVKSKY